MGGDAHGVGPVVDEGVHLVVDVVGKVVVQVVGLHGEAGVHLVVGLLQQLLDVLARAGGDGNDGNPQGPGNPHQVQLISPLFHLVHEVQGNDHGPLQLQKLGGEVQVAL